MHKSIRFNRIRWKEKQPNTMSKRLMFSCRTVGVCVCMMWHMILFEENLYYILTICCNYCTLIDTRFCIIIVEPCCRDSFREEKRTLRVIKLLKYNAFL